MMKLLGNVRELWKIGAALLLLIATNLVSSTVSWNTQEQLAEAGKMTIHAYEVLGRLDGIVAAMVDQQTGVRGYLLSGDERFLERRASGAKMVEEELAALRDLTSDDPR